MEGNPSTRMYGIEHMRNTQKTLTSLIEHKDQRVPALIVLEASSFSAGRTTCLAADSMIEGK